MHLHDEKETSKQETSLTKYFLLQGENRQIERKKYLIYNPRGLVTPVKNLAVNSIRLKPT